MTTYISLLRGINVGGQKLIKMDALRKLYEKLGFHNITTYLQSGNVVFTGKKTKSVELSQAIIRQMRNDLSLDVPVIVLTVDNLKQIIDSNPFLKQGDKEPTFLYVTFLFSKPQKFDVSLIEAKKMSGEEISISDNAIYLYCPHGYGKTKLNNKFFEAKLKVIATTRNWETIQELFKIAQEPNNK